MMISLQISWRQFLHYLQVEEEIVLYVVSIIGVCACINTENERKKVEREGWRTTNNVFHTKTLSFFTFKEKHSQCGRSRFHNEKNFCGLQLITQTRVFFFLRLTNVPNRRGWLRYRDQFFVQHMRINFVNSIFSSST